MFLSNLIHFWNYKKICFARIHKLSFLFYILWTPKSKTLYLTALKCTGLSNQDTRVGRLKKPNKHLTSYVNAHLAYLCLTLSLWITCFYQEFSVIFVQYIKKQLVYLVKNTQWSRQIGLVKNGFVIGVIVGVVTF